MYKNKKINLLDTPSIYYNVFLPSHFKHLRLQKKKYYRKYLLFLESSYKHRYLHFMNSIEKNNFFFHIERSRLNFFMRLCFKSFYSI